MSERIYHINDDGSLNEGALDHDVMMIVENEITNFLSKYGITQKEALASIRRVIDELEGGTDDNAF